MCGIAGTVNGKMSMDDINLISHRGPDYKQLIEDKLGPHSIFLGHTRLSILDLSDAGNQPMYSNCRNYCIVFNGEIYNHKELRLRLPNVNFSGSVVESVKIM